MQVIIAQMETAEPTSDGTTALRALISPVDGRRAAHTRFFVRCARALGLIQFDDVQSSLDLIALPRLTPSETPSETPSAAPGDELTISLDEQALPADERSGE